MLKTSLGRGRLASKVATTAVAAFAAALILAPTPALAVQNHNVGSDDVHISAESGSCDGHVITGTSDSGLVWNQHNVTIDGGTHVITLDNVTINDPGVERSAIDIQGNANVTLVLVGENELHGYANHPAIWVEPGSSLTIQGSGSLEARAGATTRSMGAAGIGGGFGSGDVSDFGNITINGGTVTAYGSSGGAGIGGGYATGSQTINGNITINNGFVCAYGGETVGGSTGGAGIGTGSNSDYAGTVTINGGVVYAEGSGECVSIGAGGRDFGAAEQGNFSTGTDGNAVIAAPQGIGPNRGYGEWDAIFMSTGADNDHLPNATLDGGGHVTGVTINDSDANVQSWGTPSLDYNLTIAQGTTLRVVSNDRNWDNSSLQMQAGTTLTNNGQIVLGRMSGQGSDNDGSTLVLWGGVSQAVGRGSLQVSSKAAVKLLLTKDLITVAGADDLTYTGILQQPTVTLDLSVWGYDHTFVAGVDYTLINDGGTNADDYTIVVTPVGDAPFGTGDLLGRTAVEIDYKIKPAEFNLDVPEEWSIKQGENSLLGKLPSLDNGVSLSIAASITDDMSGLRAGKLTWYTDADHKNEVTDTTLQNLAAGETSTLYWTFVHSDNNFVNPKSGETTVTISEFDVPTISFPGVTNEAISVVYGASGQRVTPMFTLNGQPLTPGAGDLTWVSSDESVVTVDANGNLEFVGAGTARVTVTLAENNDPSSAHASVRGFVTVTVSRKPIKVAAGSAQLVTRDYDGTTDVEVQGAKLEDGSIINNDDVTLVATAALRDANAGENKPATISYSLIGADVNNYVLSPASEQATVTITKADAQAAGIQGKTAEQVIYNGFNRTYDVALDQLVPEELGISSFKIGDVTIQQPGYFEESDPSLYQVRWLRVPVDATDQTFEGTVATAEITIVSRNYTDVTGTITFKAVNPLTHTITATAGKGGTISPNGTVNVIDGEGAEFTFTPDEGYKVSQVLVDGKAVEATDSYTFTGVTENHTIEVTFEKTDPTTPAHEHVWSDWKHDGDNHWKECTECGAIAEKGEHTYGDWVDLNRTDDQGRNLWEHTCSVCGYVQYGTTGGDSTDVTPIDDEGIPSAGDPTSLAPIAIAGAAGISALLARRRL